MFSGIRYELIKGSLDADICDIVDDSRQVSPNAVFVCRRGAVTNGRKYIGDAISRGAAGIIITDEVWDSEDVYDADSMSGSLGYYPDDFFVVVMHDKRYSIGRMCNNFWGYPSRELTVIGVTGTKGNNSHLHDEKSPRDLWMQDGTYWNNRGGRLQQPGAVSQHHPWSGTASQDIAQHGLKWCKVLRDGGVIPGNHAGQSIRCGF